MTAIAREMEMFKELGIMCIIMSHVVTPSEHSDVITWAAQISLVIVHGYGASRDTIAFFDAEPARH
jgi:hypothetical protein